MVASASAGDAKRGSWYRATVTQELVELLALVGVERREELVLDSLDDRAKPRQLAFAFSCEHDGVAPPVVRVALAFDQAALLEAVEQPDELSAVELEGIRNRPLRLARALGYQREDAVVVRAVTGRLQLLDRLLLDRHSQPAQQEDHALHELGRHALRGRVHHHDEISVARSIVVVIYR